jgi:hypothetical protein
MRFEPFASHIHSGSQVSKPIDARTMKRQSVAIGGSLWENGAAQTNATGVCIVVEVVSGCVVVVEVLDG